MDGELKHMNKQLAAARSVMNLKPNHEDLAKVGGSRPRIHCVCGSILRQLPWHPPRAFVACRGSVLVPSLWHLSFRTSPLLQVKDLVEETRRQMFVQQTNTNMQAADLQETRRKVIGHVRRPRPNERPGLAPGPISTSLCRPSDW